MGLITVNNDRFIANVVVQEIGDLGVAIQQVCRFHVSRHLAATTVIFGMVTFLV
jgi:hypothetical protein